MIRLAAVLTANTVLLRRSLSLSLILPPFPLSLVLTPVIFQMQKQCEMNTFGVGLEIDNSYASSTIVSQQ